MTSTEILAQVAKGTLSIEKAQALLSASNQRSLSLKVSEKGAVSLIGINARFPVTLYADQWERVLSFGGEIKAFIAANKGKLSVKADKAAA